MKALINKLFRWMFSQVLAVEYEEGFEQGQASNADEIEGAWYSGKEQGYYEGVSQGRREHCG